jgi:hypothetical protein
MMKKLLAIALISMTCAGCSDPAIAQRTLENMGYTNIEIIGWGLFAGCGRDDTFVTKFKALSPNKKNVDGVVCSGWLKGATVRFY